MDRIWDPIHSYIKIEQHELDVLDSWPVQRLKHINQLALSFLTYPSATHKRFEHSLGVMFLATLVFDKLFSNNDYCEFPELSEIINNKDYYRKVVRFAALLHDVGHLPFSHAAEANLLSNGKKHESVSIFIIEKILKSMLENAGVDPSVVAEIAVREKYYKEKGIIKPKPSHTLLSEIITGDFFGVDRIDYLLRDSYHIGLPYGRFDYVKLIETLEILKNTPVDSDEPIIGISENGIIPMESLILARFFMYNQVYYNPVRRVYNHHLGDYMTHLLKDTFHDFNIVLDYTDNEIWSNILVDYKCRNERYTFADIILNRKHYKEIYRRRKEDMDLCNASNTLEQPEEKISKLLVEMYGSDFIILDQIRDNEKLIEVPVRRKNGDIKRYSDQFNLLNKTPSLENGYIFVHSSIEDECKELLNKTTTEDIMKK